MRILRKSLLLATLLLFAALISLTALEIDTGRTRLILHEGIGRFSLYTRYTAADYVPLFVDRDPRTSGLSLVVNDKIFKLGESSEFSEKAVKTTDPITARFEWTSRTLEVVQEFTPVFSPNRSEADGVRMSIRIRNSSRKALSVGLRLCLDTYLGEENLSHFVSDRHKEIRSELTVGAERMIGYWLSASADSPQEVGLQCLTSGADLTSPDKIVFANWKRLSEASWDYKTSSNRNFNLMPYSINDSAVCMYYEPVQLPAQGSREIVLVLANSSFSGYGEITETAVAAVQSPEQPPADDPGLSPSMSPEPASILEPLDDLNNLIDKINSLLASGKEISDEEVRLIEEILSGIKDKSERYSGGR